MKCVYSPVQVELSAAPLSLQKVHCSEVSPPQMFHVSVQAEWDKQHSESTENMHCKYSHTKQGERHIQLRHYVYRTCPLAEKFTGCNNELKAAMINKTDESCDVCAGMYWSYSNDSLCEYLCFSSQPHLSHLLVILLSDDVQLTQVLLHTHTRSVTGHLQMSNICSSDRCGITTRLINQPCSTLYCP